MKRVISLHINSFTLFFPPLLLHHSTATYFTALSLTSELSHPKFTNGKAFPIP